MSQIATPSLIEKMSTQLIERNYPALIFYIRGYKVMLDSDLASLYGVATRRLKEQVKRNRERFPEDFMFELSREEKELLITTNSRLLNVKFSKVNPLVFTEHGVAMLSSILKSKKAIAINIEIIRAFSKYRAILKENRDLKKEIRQLDDKINHAFKYLLQQIDALHQKKNKKLKPIGFKIGKSKK